MQFELYIACPPQVHAIVTVRDAKHTNFVEFRNFKIIYRRYAGLYFCICVDISDNNLFYLEAIHNFVEVGSLSCLLVRGVVLFLVCGQVWSGGNWVQVLLWLLSADIGNHQIGIRVVPTIAFTHLHIV